MPKPSVSGATDGEGNNRSLTLIQLNAVREYPSGEEVRYRTHGHPDLDCSCPITLLPSRRRFRP
jgi:hypothetical protein